MFFILFFIFHLKNSKFSRGKKNPRANGEQFSFFSLPDFTVGSGISPDRLSLVDFTTGMEFHHSPKICILFCLDKNAIVRGGKPPRTIKIGIIR
jgi:hypothetical protein